MHRILRRTRWREETSRLPLSALSNTQSIQASLSEGPGPGPRSNKPSGQAGDAWVEGDVPYEIELSLEVKDEETLVRNREEAR